MHNIVLVVDYIEDYSSESTTDYLNIIYLDRHYKALFKGPVRLLQVRANLFRRCFRMLWQCYPISLPVSPPVTQ